MQFLRLLRPSHWIKNFLVFVPLIFSLNIFRIDRLILAIEAFGAFCLMASCIYVINDFLDIERDRSHHIKKNRPLASGKIPPISALVLALLLFFTSSMMAVTISPLFGAILAGYFLLNIAYSLYLKHIVIIDLILVASFYLLRVYAGAKAIDVPITSWLLFITFFLALFIVSGKRYSETVTQGHASRPVLAYYTSEFLANIMNMSATGVIVFYALYTTTKHYLFTYSIFFVLFALLRVLYWTQVEKSAEEPEKLFIKDPWLFGIILLWGIYTIVTLYVFGG
ncbi:MAG: hypothetical protein A2V81_00700 [Candidatus Abawacabacteria bacterium RBG_16_42_10]|uniref:Prenyltransferase n=1 Tax=Candidatus Abawacabacteria bacterium RBG_16_42_10 TaxID=1817814 RepID=A0A1F4XL80_9BACT|nr:MAG: hypothetical protein A2V81_00700 [Candidatus Abawacabacteria bacterium RBG_16_42_10]